MYDLPEIREQTDLLWQTILRGINSRGAGLAVDFCRPNTEREIQDVLSHPRLLLSQTCWGPISCGVTPELHILAQPDFSEFYGGQGPLYRSAIIATGKGRNLAAPKTVDEIIPVQQLAHKRLAYNDRTSLSGYLSITADMASATGEKAAFYSHAEASGSHRNSIRMVAESRADVAAIDCRTWALAQQFNDPTDGVHVIGWTRARIGLPFICSPSIEDDLKAIVTESLIDIGAHRA